MRSLRTRVLARPSTAWVLMVAVTGCASHDRLPAARWSTRAQGAAAERLATAPGSPKWARGMHPPEPRVTDPFWTSDVARPLELGRTRLVVDRPHSEIASAQAETRPAAVERGPLPGFFETVRGDLRETPGLLWADTRRVYTDPLNVVFLIGAGGASAALRPEVDDDIEDYYDQHHTFKEDWRDAFGAAGNPATHFALAGAWYLAGQRVQDAKTYEVGKRMFSVLTITGLSTLLLKAAANTEAPNGEELAWPSGHVSSTTAMATVLNEAYGPLVGVPMFGLSGLVAVERLDSGEHHFSDLVFGAALGWLVAETVMHEHHPEVFGGEVVPYVDVMSSGAGLAWVKTLGN